MYRPALALRASALALAVTLALPGCSGLLRSQFAETPPPATIELAGLDAAVSVRRDTLGIPLIDAASLDDLVYAQGFVAAEDRFAQMIGFKLIAQGRLAEMVGEPVLDIDRYMRTLNLRRSAEILLANASPEGRRLLERYAAGVNAWLKARPLPPDLKLAGYQPEPWTPLDSMSVFALINFGLAQNLQEEVGFLRLAQQVGWEKAAWLAPSYRDEPLPFDEAAKLKGLDLATLNPAIDKLLLAQAALDKVTNQGIAASNNWAIAPVRTARGASIVANDTHLPLSQPAMWHYVHARAPGFDVAGVAAAGLPGVVAGFNGKLAWGMTMVMADNQDVFLEQIKQIDGKPHYLYQGQWLPCTARTERYRMKGGKAVDETVYETRHGPLLNGVLSRPPMHDLLAREVRSGYGIAIQSAAFEADKSLDAFFALNRAQSVAEAQPILRQVRAIELNMVFGDREHIGWQVTGRYPLRAKGRGQLPSPGWNGEYEWQGYLDADKHPASLDPAAGFIATANHRTVGADYPYHLTSSWYYPERSERATELLAASRQHSAASSERMQLDRHSRLADKFRDWLGAHRATVDAAIAKLDAAARPAAEQALARLLAFDGEMSPQSADAAIYGAFLHSLALDTFGDELGGPDSGAWAAFVRLNDASYGAIDDHLLGREDSPFWDDIRTPARETKADIIARALADAIGLLKARLGHDAGQWAWGKLHTYEWETDGKKLAPYLGAFDRFGLWLVDDILNRGPYPAGGDHSTLNVAAYPVGVDFHTWLVPAMRIIVDFGRDEPMQVINAGGQSSHPGSPHYADGIDWWLDGRYQPMPFKQVNIDAQYRERIELKPAGK
ncbi:penicillin acylase family protein [Chitinivorax sp. PXF-14]|uniref:penicillin acylase family protein n=1 Tax=Chitinivorax sp. PXF-14 TaxID=3230488 RepID=UPI003465A5F5